MLKLIVLDFISSNRCFALVTRWSDSAIKLGLAHLQLTIFKIFKADVLAAKVKPSLFKRFAMLSHTYLHN